MTYITPILVIHHNIRTLGGSCSCNDANSMSICANRPERLKVLLNLNAH